MEGERKQPVPNKSHQKPLCDENQALWGHFCDRKANCRNQEDEDSKKNKKNSLALPYYNTK